MKKLLAVLGSISLLASSTISVVACESPGGKDEKVELKEFNKENVENFFKENHKFKYEGEFIFIDEPSETMEAKLSTQSFLNWIFIKTVINEMSKTINVETEDFYQFYAEIDRNHYDTQVEENQSLVSGKIYNFKFNNMKINDTKNNQDFELVDFEFEFKQTNRVTEDKIKEKELENLTNNWYWGINSSKNQKMNPVYATHGNFSKIAGILESGEIDSAKTQIKEAMDKLSNAKNLGGSNTTLYEKYKFTSEIKDIKILPNQTDKFIFAEVSGEATLVGDQSVKSKFSATWAFFK